MNNVENSLVGELTPFFAAEGFKWVKSRANFVRKEPHGFSSFSWASYQVGDEGGRIELVPLLAVRHDLVEDVVNELGLVYGDSNKRFTATVDRGLGFFPFKSGEDEKQYIRIASFELDIEKVVTNIVSMVNSHGRIFLRSILLCLNVRED
ncbi:hypothetical protein [Xanthomonas oryzae]|uniref:hypothetical protein n=1 Tax=Xanthomonas oryzae TaxID=347 RepID=UPI001033184B|nr:hypothetical protein [Xanthomonas oryzae]QBH01545.1 hypothetical protein EYC56_22745 [Xanthomonas oryzae]